MPTILSGVLIAGLSASLLYGCARWLNRYSGHLSQASELMEKFYRSAQSLTRDDRVPDGVLRLVEFMAENAGKSWVARSFVWHLIFGKRAHDRNSQLARDISSLRGERAKTFAEMMVFGLMASALADPVFASIYLNLLTNALTKSGRGDDAPSEERAGFAAMDLATHAGICNA